MEIIKSNENNKILLTTESTFVTNIGWEDNITQFENEALKTIINPKNNFETTKFTHSPYNRPTLPSIKQDDIWFYFHFYSDNVGLSHNGGLNYEFTGLSLDENVKVDVNTTESFFRLDFYKIPFLSGTTLDYYNKKLVLTKNLRIPLGEKVYYEPIKDHVLVPVFMGSSYKNEENMNIYWLTDEKNVYDTDLYSNNLYMTARYYNSIDGSINNFTISGITIDETPEEKNVYYRVTLNRNNNTFYVSNMSTYQICGPSYRPITFYASSLGNSSNTKYIEQLDCIMEANSESNYILITVTNGTPNYIYNLYSGNTLIISSSSSSNVHTFSNIHCGDYNVKIIDSNQKEYRSNTHLQCVSFTYNVSYVDRVGIQINI